MNEQFKKLLREFINETVIRRRGGEEVKIASSADRISSFSGATRGNITSIGDIKISPKEAKNLSLEMNSPFMQGPAFHAIYNGGVGEENKFVKIKSKEQKRASIWGEDDNEENVKKVPTLANYRIGEKGSYVYIPELFLMVHNPATVDRAFGVGFVKNIENFPTSTPGYDAPLAQIEFADDQKPPGHMNTQNMVGLAFVCKLSEADALVKAEQFSTIKKRTLSKGASVKDPIVAAQEEDDD